MAQYAKRGISAVKVEEDARQEECRCCGSVAEETNGGTRIYGFKAADEQGSSWQTAQAFCDDCREACETVVASHFGKCLASGAGTEATEWEALLSVADDVGSGIRIIKGWSPGDEWEAKRKNKKAEGGVNGRPRASDFFGKACTADGRTTDVEIGTDGKLKEKMSTAAKIAALWHIRKQSTLLADVLAVERIELSSDTS